jgi:hypothetical protein
VSLFSLVVEPFDVIKHVGSGFGSGQVSFSIHPFPLQHTKEAFRCGIVVTAADCAHAADDAVRSQEQLVFMAGVL